MSLEKKEKKNQSVIFETKMSQNYYICPLYIVSHILVKFKG